jgi:hypothetical protein
MLPMFGCCLLVVVLQLACEGWQEGVEALRRDMAAGRNPSPDRVRDLLLSAAATGAALGHMDDLQVSTRHLHLPTKDFVVSPILDLCKSVLRFLQES